MLSGQFFTLLLLALAVPFAHAQTGLLRNDAGLPEDPNVRAAAIRLLEQAVQVSTPPSWTNVQIDTRFHVANPAPGEPSEGEHILTVGAWWKLRRHEWNYGSNHLILVRNGDLAYWPVDEGQKPPFADVIENTTPIDLVRFNREDVVHSISEGPNGSQCINFDIVFGDREEPGQICVDARQHWMISKRVGDTLTLNSNFVSFNQAFVPQHVEISVSGAQRFLFEQTITAKSDFPPEFFTVPEDATIKMGVGCKEFRQAHPFNVPQPAPLTSSPTFTDVRLQGVVGADGHVSFLRAVDNLYPELNQQAMQVVSQWTFTPANCDGKLTAWYTDFIVEFKGR